jgi:large subunit ribosomal protein L2
MKLKRLKPITSSTRNVKRIKKSLLARSNRLVRSIMIKKNSGNGRSKTNGRITVRHKGSGAKKLYRFLHDAESIKDLRAIRITTCYDPNRNSFINLHFNIITKRFFYTNATQEVELGSLWKNVKDFGTERKFGLRSPVGTMYPGTLVHNVNSDCKKQSSYIKAAGTYGVKIQSASKLTKIRLPSGKFLEVQPTTYATIGRTTNSVDRLQRLGKAGTRRHMGIRPSVRGIAMNPVDHPHGGRTNGGVTSRTPWGLKCKSGYYLKKKKNKYKYKYKK